MLCVLAEGAEGDGNSEDDQRSEEDFPQRRFD
jgi:hypothetical protein